MGEGNMEKKSLQIRMADLSIQINYKYTYIERQCAGWLDESGRKPDIEVEVSDEEIETEYTEFAADGVTRGMCESVCIYRAIARKLIPFSAFVMHGAVIELDGKAYVFTAKSGVVTRGMCESVCIYRAIARKLIPFSAFVMHGAVIELDGKAYVFTAKSGVGKTTHTKLWLEYFKGRASYINGDKPIIRYQNGRWYAYGTAWMGKEKFGSPKYAPIQSVCFIERGIENEIRKIDDKEVVERLFHQLFLPEEPESLMQFMELIDGMVCEIPFFVLKCNISLAAVKVAYETLSKS